jgi:hypothetical protein
MKEKNYCKLLFYNYLYNKHTLTPPATTQGVEQTGLSQLWD